ncbi:Ankrd17, partial [Symbiodinium microadriaticum]
DVKSFLEAADPPLGAQASLCERQPLDLPVEIRTIGGGSHTFVMYTVPADAFLQMTEVQTHEELADAGVLSEFDESLGKAMFVSHQWLSDTHPDPDFQQLKVLQDTLRNIVAGTSSISEALLSEIMYGRRRCPTPGDFASDHLHIWYDYFSIPQSHDQRASQGRQTAIQSIPTYVARCEFFVVLCPALEHRDQKRTLSHATWGERGWCRTERVARELSTHRGGYVIIVESAAHQTLLWKGLSMRDAPGEGEFTLDGDRVWIGRIVTQMVWSKLFYYLEHRQFHNYRFLLNAQMAQYFRSLDVEPIDGLVPGFHTETDPSVDCKGFMLEHFLHQNGLRSIFERDDAGWPPILFAAMSNNVVVLEALLDRKVDINQATTKPASEANLPGKLTALGIAAFLRNNEAVELLLCARAHVNYKDSYGGNALHIACAGDNPHAVRLLCHARASVNQQCIPQMSPFIVSCACASRHAMKEMLTLNPGLSLRHCLHIALMLAGGGGANVVSDLLEARADVNEQFRVHIREPGWWLLMNVMGVRHRVSPSRLTLLAYHHCDATPLMFSILSGSLDSVSSLLSARARVDIQNYRKSTASDLARQMLAPSWLIEVCSTKGQQDTETFAESDTFFI